MKIYYLFFVYLFVIIYRECQFIIIYNFTGIKGYVFVNTYPNFSVVLSSFIYSFNCKERSITCFLYVAKHPPFAPFLVMSQNIILVTVGFTRSCTVHAILEPLMVNLLSKSYILSFVKISSEAFDAHASKPHILNSANGQGFASRIQTKFSPDKSKSIILVSKLSNTDCNGLSSGVEKIPSAPMSKINRLGWEYDCC